VELTGHANEPKELNLLGSSIEQPRTT